MRGKERGEEGATLMGMKIYHRSAPPSMHFQTLRPGKGRSNIYFLSMNTAPELDSTRSLLSVHGPCLQKARARHRPAADGTLASCENDIFHIVSSQLYSFHTGPLLHLFPYRASLLSSASIILQRSASCASSEVVQSSEKNC